jgi:hypothetical protein
VEAAARLDRRADNDELGPPVCGDRRDVLAEQSRPGPDDLAPHPDAVGEGDRRGRVEPVAQLGDLRVEPRLQRQRPLDDERGDEDDARTAIGGEPAREIERVLRLLPLEQRHDDAPIGDRAGPAGQAVGATTQLPDVGKPHRTSRYGTEARITFGSRRSKRFR